MAKLAHRLLSKDLKDPYAVELTSQYESGEPIAEDLTEAIIKGMGVTFFWADLLVRNGQFTTGLVISLQTETGVDFNFITHAFIQEGGVLPSGSTRLN